MKPNTPPRFRKAPFSVVLLSLLLASCTSEDGHEYDVPAGEQVQKLKLEVDADGTPVLVAEVAMFYTTKARLQTWEPKYIQANTQSIAYTGTAGGWKKHPFRNIGWSGLSQLVRNAKGELRTIIADRRTFSLYGRNAGDWIRKSAYKVPDGFGYQTMTLSDGRSAVIMEGDSEWQSLIWNYETQRMEVRRNDGAAFPLDSGFNIRLLNTVSRPDFNMVLGVKQSVIDTAPQNGPPPLVSELVSYAWSPGGQDPKPRKRMIAPRNFASLFFAKVEGEERMYGFVPPDTLAEFSMRGEELDFLRDIDLPDLRVTGTILDPNLYPINRTARDSGISSISDLLVDAAGCIHYIHRHFDSWGDPNFQGVQPVYSHSSTCRTGVDTLLLPLPDTVYSYQPTLTGFRFSPQGEMMVGLFQQRVPKGPYEYDTGVAPSWIYLARLKGRTWEWEKIAEFEGSGVD